MILLLKAEPYVIKRRYLQLLTRSRREGEMHAMELEEKRLDLLQYIKVIHAKDEVIKELERKQAENVYLIKVMRRKIGNDFAIAHVDTNTETVFAEKFPLGKDLTKKHAK